MLVAAGACWVLRHGAAQVPPAGPVLAAAEVDTVPATTTAPEAPGAPASPPESDCGSADPVVVATGPGATVSICLAGQGLVYHGTRAVDGASITLPASREGSTWVVPHDDVTYLVGDGELLVTRSGITIDTQRFDGWWVRTG